MRRLPILFYIICTSFINVRYTMYLFIRKLQWRLPTIDNVNIWKIPYYLYPILAFKHPGKWYLQALSTSDVLNWFREHVTNSSKIDVRSMYAIYTLLWVYTFLYIFVYTFLWKDTQFSRIFTQRFYYINYLLSSRLIIYQRRRVPCTPVFLNNI